MGYGSTAFAQAPTNVLTELELSIVPLLQCNQILPSDTGVPDGLLDSQICAKDYERNRDTCQVGFYLALIFFRSFENAYVYMYI